METLMGTAGLVFVGAITPGPNNLIVMREAARRGWKGALPAIVGIVAGGLALLLIAGTGAGAAFESRPRLAASVAIAGCVVLAGIGARLILRTYSTAASPAASESSPLPATVRALFVFQFLNPKAWVLVLTATSAAQPGRGALAALADLAVVFVVIPTSCLLLWATAGNWMSRHTENTSVRIWIDRILGALLVGFAMLLWVESVRNP